MNAPPQNQARCRELAHTVTEIIVALIREHAVDGKVALSDVERIAAMLDRGTMVLDNVFSAHEERCRAFFLKPKGNVGARSNPFQRLMVRPFEHLLTGDPPPFPRPLLANYFEFLEHALGPDREEFERHSRAIVQALLVIHGNNLTWDTFYSDARTVKTLHAALKDITRYLSGPDGQRVWHSCLARSVGDCPAPTIPQMNEIRQVLLETHRGLSASDE